MSAVPFTGPGYVKPVFDNRNGGPLQQESHDWRKAKAVSHSVRLGAQ
jgi:hypothetical protein